MATKHDGIEGLEAAIAYCGGIAPLARRAGYRSESAVSNMRTRGWVAPEAVPRFVRATDHTITPHRFRPDLYGPHDTGP